MADQVTDASAMEPREWARGLLAQLGVPHTDHNVRALMAWMHAEGGHWNNDAEYNPLNATYRMPGSLPVPGRPGLQRYVSREQGLNATAAALADEPYSEIREAFKHGQDPERVITAVGSSQGGTDPGRLSEPARWPTPRSGRPRARRELPPAPRPSSASVRR